MRLWLPALLLLVPLACDRPEEGADAQVQALQAATEELAAARAAFEADRAAMQQELAALREAVDAANAKLELLAMARPRRAASDLLGEEGAQSVPPVPSVPRVVEDPAALAAAVRCESETRCTVERSYLETLIVNPGGMAKQARIVPAAGVDGAVEGFKLYGIRPGSLFKALGVKNGDLVRSINGHTLDSVERAMEVYAKLRHAKSYTIELERRGTPLTLTIEIVGDP